MANRQRMDKNIITAYWGIIFALFGIALSLLGITLAVVRPSFPNIIAITSAVGGLIVIVVAVYLVFKLRKNAQH